MNFPSFRSESHMQEISLAAQGAKSEPIHGIKEDPLATLKTVDGCEHVVYMIKHSVKYGNGDRISLIHGPHLLEDRSHLG